jgi:hypothetical protein
MMYEGGMSEEVRENRRKRSLLGTEGSGEFLLSFLRTSWLAGIMDGRMLIHWAI